MSNFLIVETEAVETCPFCEGECVYPNWNTSKQGYVATCPHCGKKIFLCDECLHAEDNPRKKCDYQEDAHCDHCFRASRKK